MVIILAHLAIRTGREPAAIGSGRILVYTRFGSVQKICRDTRLKYTNGQRMFSTSMLEHWFTYSTQHMRGFVRGAVFVRARDSVQYQPLVTSGVEFVQDQSVLQSIDSVIKKRSAVVRKLKYNESQQSSARVGNAPSTVRCIDQDQYMVCAPLLIERDLVGVVCVVLEKRRDDRSHDVLADVNNAVNWLPLLMNRTVQASPDHRSAMAATGIAVCAITLSQESAYAAAAAAVSALAQHLGCERVAIGFVQGSDVSLYAMSNNAGYEARQNIIRRIEAAIQEAADQQETLVYPPREGNYQSLHAHAELARHHDSSAICSVPVVHVGEVIGGICFERSGGENRFIEDDIELCEQLSSLIGPMIEYRRRDDQSLSQKIITSLDTRLKLVTGCGRPGLKLLAVVSLLAFAATFIIHWEYRVTANASLEGAIERVITAPEEGFIKDAPSRPGDLIAQDQVLATLDDRDLQLEKQKWSGKQQQVNREYREALATHDRSKIGVLRAQLDQAEAQIAILDKKLQRTRISTPITGVVVSGDYTRSLGSPVEKGQILYKVSPLDDYRVLLEVDEADVTEIAVGMRGELTLNAAAEDSYIFNVERITPVSRAENGSNFYEIEASLEKTPEFLRPGMQGVGKIIVGDRQLFWIWTHQMIDWIRLKIWSWW
jgi:multidrug resistance efflux pump